MILHLVFSAVSCSPEVFLIFRMSVERNMHGIRERERASEESFISCPFPPRGKFFKNEKIAISIKEEKKNESCARVSKRKHTHPQSVTPAGTPSGPVAPPASARARSALSSPFLILLLLLLLSRCVLCVCARIFFMKKNLFGKFFFGFLDFFHPQADKPPHKKDNVERPQQGDDDTDDDFFSANDEKFTPSASVLPRLLLFFVAAAARRRRRIWRIWIRERRDDFFVFFISPNDENNTSTSISDHRHE